jgi:hypothetical protein
MKIPVFSCKINVINTIHKILKWHELPVNTLTRDAIKLWIEKNKDLNH